MGDKIYIDTELLRQISSQLSQVHHSLSAVHQKLGGSVSEVRGMVSDQVGLINVLSSVQGNTQKAADYTARLAKAVNNAAARWEEVERRLANQQIQGSEAAPQGAGGGIDSKIALWRGAVIGSIITLIGPAMAGPLGPGILAGMGAVGLEILAEKNAGSVFEESLKINATWEDIKKNPMLLFPTKPGEYSVQEYNARYGNFFAKGSLGNSSLKTNRQANWIGIKHDEQNGVDQNSGIIGISADAVTGINAVHLEYGYRGKYLEVSKKDNYYGGSVSGGVGATLYKEGQFDPKAYIGTKEEGYAGKSEASVRVGTEETNGFVGLQVSVGGAGIEGRAGGYKDAGGQLLAELYAAKGEIKGGFELFGIKASVSGTGMYGMNKTIGADIGMSAAQGTFGLGPIRGKVNIDWSKFATKYL